MMHFSLIFVYVHSPVCICAFVTVISLYLPSGLVYTDVFLLFILSFVYLNVLAMTVFFFFYTQRGHIYTRKGSPRYKLFTFEYTCP